MAKNEPSSKTMLTNLPEDTTTLPALPQRGPLARRTLALGNTEGAAVEEALAVEEGAADEEAFAVEEGAADGEAFAVEEGAAAEEVFTVEEGAADEKAVREATAGALPATTA